MGQKIIGSSSERVRLVVGARCIAPLQWRDAHFLDMSQIIKPQESGQALAAQALVEYALIVALVGLALVAAIALTGPAIANVFSNTVNNLVGQDASTVPDVAIYGAPGPFWQTVTWVARYPQQETAYPLLPPPPPTLTPTAGPIREAPPTPPSPTPTATIGPSPTPSDKAFTLPFIDTVDNPEWWRLDSGVYLGGDEWVGQYYPNTDLSGPPDFQIPNSQLPGTNGQNGFNIDFNWGSGGPMTDPLWRVDNFSIRFTRSITLAQDMALRFVIHADDGARLLVDGAVIYDRWSDNASLNANVGDVTQALKAGGHALELDYYERGGAAGVSLDISGAGTSSNPDDHSNIPGGPVDCAWNRVSGSDSNSLNWMFSDNPDGEFHADMTCYLELRGLIDLGNAVNPQLSFWDVWDLTGGGTATGLEIAEYNPNRANMRWIPIALHSGDANYEWTRETIDLNAYQMAGKRLALRFVMSNTGGGVGPRRWYIDDLQVVNNSDPRTYFTVGSQWSLDTTDQKNDFITSGRWDLTANNPHRGTGWDDSPGYFYDAFSQGGPRIHYVEFKHPIDLRQGVAPAADADGNTGPPILTFWEGYDIAPGASIQVQYTRDPLDTVPDHWAAVPDGGLLQDFPTERTTNLTMQAIHLALSSIPNYDTQPFRLRFALIVNQGGGQSADGWYLDDISIERQGGPRFTAYPFSDGAESGDGSQSRWLFSGQWGITNATGAFGSANSFTDSPDGSYLPNRDSAMELRGPIDLFHDSPDNNADPPGRAPAEHPMLTFWHWRSLSIGASLRVEMKTNSTNWTSIWAYYYDPLTRTQFSWERVEIDLKQAFTTVTGLDWDAARRNNDPTDDDISLRIVLSSGPSSNEGVFIDDVQVSEFAPTVFQLTRGGTYTDDIEGGSWRDRWYTGGSWWAIPTGGADISGAPWTNTSHSGTQAFHDSSTYPQGGAQNTNYLDLTFSVLEMRTLMDLTPVSAADNPMLSFWTRFDIGNADTIEVQIAREDPTSAAQGYDRIGGWDAWETVWSRGPSVRVDTWNQQQISLAPYTGARIRVRFVLNAYQDAINLRDGWYIDDVSVQAVQPRVFNLPFYDRAQSMANWIGEGSWGLSPDQWYGAGGGPADLGSSPWQGYYFDCEAILGHSCASPDDFDTLLNRPDSQANLTETVNDIIFNLGATGKPLNSADDTWLDTYGARWERTIQVAEGDYTIIASADDGVRIRCDDCPWLSAGWNIIDQWHLQASTLYLQTIHFPAGTYHLTVEWFEATGSASLTVSLGDITYAFTDSPNRPNADGQTYTVAPSAAYGSSSLVLNGVLNLSGATDPVLEYETLYDLNDGAVVLLEVSTDDGATWTQAGLSGPDSPIFGGPASNMQNWQLRRYDLSAYRNMNIRIRFRLTTNGGASGDGWTISEIRVRDAP